MMCAMLAEIEAAGADQSGARGSYPAHEGLATALACGAIKGIHMIDPGEAAELMRHVVSAYGDMSAADRAEVDTQLMRRFISHAANVDALTLQQLLTAWCNSLPAQAPREAGQLREAWERALPRLGPPAADVVNAFMHVAAGSAPALQLPRPTRPVGHAAECELAAALSRMDVASMQAALRCIGRAELPGELRNEVTRNVLQQYPRMQIDLRPAALDLCFSWDPARTCTCWPTAWGGGRSSPAKCSGPLFCSPFRWLRVARPISGANCCCASPVTCCRRWRFWPSAMRLQCPRSTARRSRMCLQRAAETAGEPLASRPADRRTV